uniref:Uncharacterized protein n=1 Tax=Spironucleus salmonicida TaxID=348837 RepID=V6LV80_9EUKA|eukprot:EST48153.1 hypothetical protein SS50377_11670 [Spironucleus salmonicida]
MAWAHQGEESELAWAQQGEQSELAWAQQGEDSELAWAHQGEQSELAWAQQGEQSELAWAHQGEQSELAWAHQGEQSELAGAHRCNKICAKANINITSKYLRFEQQGVVCMRSYCTVHLSYAQKSIARKLGICEPYQCCPYQPSYRTIMKRFQATLHQQIMK